LRKDKQVAMKKSRRDEISTPSTAIWREKFRYKERERTSEVPEKINGNEKKGAGQLHGG